MEHTCLQRSSSFLLNLKPKSHSLACKALDDLALAYLFDLISCHLPTSPVRFQPCQPLSVLRTIHAHSHLKVLTPSLLSAYNSPSSTRPTSGSFWLFGREAFYDQSNRMGSPYHLPPPYPPQYASLIVNQIIYLLSSFTRMKDHKMRNSISITVYHHDFGHCLAHSRHSIKCLLNELS